MIRTVVKYSIVITAFMISLFGTGKVNAAAYSGERVNLVEDEMPGLLQDGSFSIPKHRYSFDKENIEYISTYLSGEDTDNTLADKQQAAQTARGEDNSTLPERKKACAQVLYAGMAALEKRIDVAQFALTREEFKEVISDVINSNPELFYIRNGYKIAVFELSEMDSTQIVDYCCGFYEYQDAEYNPERNTIQALITKVENKRDAILSAILAAGMNHVEKALMIHEYLVLNTEYDYEKYLRYIENPVSNPIPDGDYDIYGTLINGKAVCQGYALSYKYLLEAAGVDNVGFASNATHVWNTVSLGGAGYYVDCTWDDPVWDTLGNVKHKYFLKGEDNFNHTIDDTDRVCKGTAYDNMFWNTVDSGIFYYRGAYYYIGNDGDLYKTKFRTSTDIAAGSSRVSKLGLEETGSWDYDNGAKMGMAESFIVYHDSRNLYFCNPKTGEKQLLYTPNLAENELIYGLVCQNREVFYATRQQNMTGTEASYRDEEQKIYQCTVPEEYFYVPVESITISGNRVIRMTAESGKMTSEKIDLKASLLPENATDKRISKWTSSDTTVAVVDINGRVKGISPGEVTITALSYDGIKGSCYVKVIYDGTVIDKNGEIRYYENGKLLANQFYQIEGKTYYLGADGRRISGWSDINGKRYYINENGILTGWQTIDGNRYYFGTDGGMVTGWQIVSGKRYYFNGNGVMLTDWQTIGGKRYYFNSEGALLSVGWKTINGKKYYFNKDGGMVTGWQRIKKKKYYFAKNGVMQTGFKTIKKKKYYFNKSGAMQTGFKTIKKKKYYFNKSGVMQTGFKTIKKKKYYFNKKGIMQTGWKTIKGKKYYFDKKGVMKKGLQWINGVSYYFARDGHLVS